LYEYLEIDGESYPFWEENVLFEVLTPIGKVLGVAPG